MACYLTADGGTESLRVRLYDLEGNCLGQKAVPYETRFSPGARAEQDPEDWWRALVGLMPTTFQSPKQWPATFQPLSSRLPAPKITPPSVACLAPAHPGIFAPFRPAMLCIKCASKDLP